MLKPFHIHQPKDSAETFQLMSEMGDAAALYAGGTELLPVMREGLASYTDLIDLKVSGAHSEIEIDQDKQIIRIGALATHRLIEKSKLISQHVPILNEVEKMIANVRVRETGTIGGNLCFADPNSDPATLIMAWEGAKIELQSSSLTRLLTLGEFFLEPYITARNDDEMMTALVLPIPQDQYGAAFEKFVYLERPTVNVATFIFKAGEIITQANLAVGSACPIPIRVEEVERLMLGKEASKDLAREAGEKAAQIVETTSDHYGSAEYKSHLVSVMVTKAINQSFARMEGKEMLVN